jgi:hypothetical protein
VQAGWDDHRVDVTRIANPVPIGIGAIVAGHAATLVATGVRAIVAGVVVQIPAAPGIAGSAVQQVRDPVAVQVGPVDLAHSVSVQAAAVVRRVAATPVCARVRAVVTCVVVDIAAAEGIVGLAVDRVGDAIVIAIGLTRIAAAVLIGVQSVTAHIAAAAIGAGENAIVAGIGVKISAPGGV